jgi:general L-amino acid transport system permease protein
VQLIFIYSGIFLRLPDLADIVASAPADAKNFVNAFWISNKGFALPALWPTAGITAWTVAVVIGLVVAVTLYRRRRRKMIDMGQLTYPLEAAALTLIGVVVLATLIFGPYTISQPEVIRRSARIVRFDSNTGVIVSPEYVALALGLILYTAAFIAEVVRAGIQSVPNGQWEAARAVGLTGGQALRLVILPQALRVMFPPLTNLYSALLKNSALGAYIGFSDLFGVGRTIQLQSGQSIPVTVIVMAIYLILTLLISFLMNQLNARFQFKTR